ncbi:MAG: rhodanese-like domain-containing protein [Agathobacter sp.]
MKKIVMVVLSIMLLSGCGTAASELSYKQISTDEAVTMMQEESDYIILGAICIPNETIGSDEISELADKDQLIMVYCRSGNRSKQAAEKLVKLGYTNIVEFGGIND